MQRVACPQVLGEGERGVACPQVLSEGERGVACPQVLGEGERGGLGMKLTLPQKPLFIAKYSVII